LNVSGTKSTKTYKTIFIWVNGVQSSATISVNIDPAQPDFTKT